jgi:hypothetical protein
MSWFFQPLAPASAQLNASANPPVYVGTASFNLTSGTHNILPLAPDVVSVTTRSYVTAYPALTIVYPPLAVSNIGGNITNNGGSSDSYGSFTSVVNNYYLVTINNASATTVSSVTSTNGITFSLIKTQAKSTGFISVYGGICTSPSSGSITITLSGASTFQWTVDRIAGMHPTGTIVQSVSALANNVTLPSFDPINVSFFAACDNSTQTIEAGWTGLADISGSPNFTKTAYKLVGDGTPSFTGAGTNPAIIGIEIRTIVPIVTQTVDTKTFALNMNVGGSIQAQSTGYMNAGAARTGTWITGGTIDWTSASNITASDNTYASVTLGTGQVAYDITAYNFGHSLPSDAVFNGFQVRTEGYRPSSFTYEPVAYLTDAAGSGTPAGATNMSYASQTWTVGTTDSVSTLGGTADTWGGRGTSQSAWTHSQVNSANFGVLLYYFVNGTATTGTMYIDNIQLNIHYTSFVGPHTVTNVSSTFPTLMLLGYGT